MAARRGGGLQQVVDGRGRAGVGDARAGRDGWQAPGVPTSSGMWLALMVVEAAALVG